MQKLELELNSFISVIDQKLYPFGKLEYQVDDGIFMVRLTPNKYFDPLCFNTTRELRDLIEEVGKEYTKNAIIWNNNYQVFWFLDLLV